ncbi:MAG: T9SS type A sorting domain-containing protein [Bacteroidia bacterium]
MKTALLTFVLGTLSLGAVGQSSIPNGAFENWTSTNVENPKYFTETSNREIFRSGFPVNCVKTTDAYHGSFAVKLTSVGDQNNSMPGYMVNGDPSNNPEEWHGGIPYNQQATGMRGYYKSDVKTGDTALVIVAFSKAGVNIGIYVYKITGVQSTYALFDFTFDPPLLIAPDSVLIGATSSNVMADDLIVGSMLQLDSISFTGVGSQPANLNGDFEEWTTTTYEKPDTWNIESDDAQVSFKSTDAYKGSYSVRLETSVGTNEQGQTRTYPTTVSTGYYPENCGGNCNQQGGYPFSNQYDTLVFWYKYTAAAGSKGVVSYSVRKNGQIINGNWIELNASATYQKFEVPISAFPAPDTLVVDFQSCRWEDSLTIQVGSILIVDEVQLKSAPLKTGLWMIKKTTNIRVYPNPTKGIIQIDAAEENLIEGATFVLMNALGQEVHSVDLHGASNQLSLTDLPAGAYYYVIRSGTLKIQNGKLIISE